MAMSNTGVLCAIQGGLLDTITPNIRLITASFTEHTIDLYFYYDEPPSENEEELSEEVSTEVMCSFRDMPNVMVHRIVIPKPEALPKEEDKIAVYARFEKHPPS
jgi:hypothetical protein